MTHMTNGELFEVKFCDIFELLDCKMFSIKLIKVKRIHESLPTAWVFSKTRKR